MLARGQARAEAEGLRIRTHHQSMEALSLPRTYRAIYLAGPTFNVLPDDDAARRALRAIGRHLRGGGQAMIPLWIPPAARPDELGRTREATTPDGATARHTVESEDYDEQRRTRRTHTRSELARDGRVEQVHRDWIIHWHTPDGFAALAGDAGLDVVATEPMVRDEFTTYLQNP